MSISTDGAKRTAADHDDATGQEAPNAPNGGRGADQAGADAVSAGQTGAHQSGAAGQDARLARSAARLAAVQALYQMELTAAPLPEVEREFETWRLGAEIDGAQYREPDLDLFRRLLEGVVARQREIDPLTDAALVERWPLGRVDPTLRAIFRAGGFELVASPDLPARVIVTEYVDVAKAFFAGGQEPRFVNAVLDHMARRVRGDAAFPPAPSGGARS